MTTPPLFHSTVGWKIGPCARADTISVASPRCPSRPSVAQTAAGRCWRARAEDMPLCTSFSRYETCLNHGYQRSGGGLGGNSFVSVSRLSPFFRALQRCLSLISISSTFALQATNPFKIPRAGGPNIPVRTRYLSSQFQRFSRPKVIRKVF